MNNALLHWNLLETRWRFLIGLVLLSLSAISTVLTYPSIAEMVPQLANMNLETRLGRVLNEAIELQATFRGYLWSQLFRQNLTELTALFAALLGTGAQFLRGAGRSTVFILSLPVTRQQLFLSRTIVGLAELLVLVLVAALMASVVAPAIGEQFSVADALVHALSLFIVGAIFFGLAALLSTVFEDPWRPLLITCGVYMLLAFLALIAEIPSLLAVMSAQRYFESGDIPWLGWLIAMTLTALLLYGGALNLDRRDF